MQSSHRICTSASARQDWQVSETEHSQPYLVAVYVCVCVRFWCQPTFALASLPTSHRGALTPVQRLNYRSCIHLFSWFRSSIWFHMKGCITKYIEGSYQWNVTIGSDNRHVQKPTSTSKFLSNSTFENDRRGKRRSSGQQQVHWGSHCKAILNHGRVGDLKML